MVKNPSANAGDARDMGSVDVLEKEMAAHSSILAREIPGTEEPSGLQSPWGLKESTELLNTHLHYIGLGPIRRQRHRVT